MSDNSRPFRFGFPFVSVGLGVFWFVWGAKGFWWGLWYGAFWPSWVGYRLAAWLMWWLK